MRRVGLLLLLGLCACPHHGVKFGPEGQITDPAQLLAALDARDKRFLTLSGEAKLKVVSPEQSGSVGQVLAAIKPAMLHVETDSFFGKPISMLVSDGSQFSFYDAEHNAFYKGPATPEVASRFLPLALPPEVAVALLLGDVPRITPESSRLDLDDKRGVYVLVLTRGKVTQTLEVATDDLRILHSHIAGQGGFDLKLEDYKPEPAGPFPHKLTLDVPEQQLQLTYKYGEVTVNGAPDVSLFHQEPPASATITDLSQAGQPQVQHTP